MPKFKLIRTLSELVLLVFALNVIYDHLRELWLDQSGSWSRLMIYRWLPVIAAIVFVLLVAGFEWFCVRMEYKEQIKREQKENRRYAVISAIAKKAGITEDDIQQEQELSNTVLGQRVHKKKGLQ